MPPLTKIEMLRRFNQGKEDGRNAVYVHYHDSLLVTARRITNDYLSAEDLVNDTFVEFYKCTRTFEELKELRDFLFNTAKNLCINYLKKQEYDQKKYIELDARRLYNDEDFYADISYSETRSLLFKSVEDLPDKLKTVFRLRFFEDLPNVAVAHQLKIAVKTAYNRYYEARQQLKWDLERIQRFTLYLLNLFI